MTVHITVADMDVELADFVKETTQTEGTGSYALDGVSEDAMQSFVSGVGSGSQTIYSCVLGTSREVGVGTVTSGAPDTLSRDFILSSTNGGLQIDWGPGVKTIHLDASAALLEQITSREETHEIQAGDNATGLIIRNDDDVQVIQLRVTSGADGAVTVRTADDTTTVQLRSNQNSRGSLQLNDFEVYPLGEGLGTARIEPGSPLTDVITFTGIRSDARRITIMISELSLSGTEDLELLLGDSGGLEITDYASLHQQMAAGTVTQTTGPTDAFLIGTNTAAGGRYYGTVILTLVDPATNLWLINSTLVQRLNNVGSQFCFGNKSLSGTLSQLQVKSSGANTFDIGTVNILVE